MSNGHEVVSHCHGQDVICTQHCGIHSQMRWCCSAIPATQEVEVKEL
jgi:hypothetical protein